MLHDITYEIIISYTCKERYLSDKYRFIIYVIHYSIDNNELFGIEKKFILRKY